MYGSVLCRLLAPMPPHVILHLAGSWLPLNDMLMSLAFEFRRHSALMQTRSCHEALRHPHNLGKLFGGLHERISSSTHLRSHTYANIFRYDLPFRLQNPWKDHPRSLNPPQRPAYPAKFKQVFEGPDAPGGGYMWAAPKEPAVLDYKNAIIALIGRSPNLGQLSCQSWTAFSKTVN